MGFQMPGAFIFPYQDLYWSCGQEFYIAWSEIGLNDADGGETMPSVKFPGSIKARSILFYYPWFTRHLALYDEEQVLQGQ